MEMNKNQRRVAILGYIECVVRKQKRAFIPKIYDYQRF